MKNNENGRSMVEMLGVLAIIGVLSAGGLAGYSKAMYKYRVNETMNQLTMIVSNIRTLFGSQSTYTGLGTSISSPMSAQDALKYGIVTPDMLKDSALQNPFKGAIKIAPSIGRKANDNETFIIEYDSLPAEACVTIVTSDWGSGAGSGLVGIAAYNVGGTGAATSGTVNKEIMRDSKTPKAGSTTGEFEQENTPLNDRLITQAASAPFTIAAAVAACRPTSTADNKDTSQNASVALKYY